VVANGPQRPRLLLGRRPPPWLALPPLLAISRRFSGLIAANPRREPVTLPVLVLGIMHLLFQRM
jgi:hypothetical protein